MGEQKIVELSKEAFSNLDRTHVYIKKHFTTSKADEILEWLVSEIYETLSSGLLTGKQVKLKNSKEVCRLFLLRRKRVSVKVYYREFEDGKISVISIRDSRMKSIEKK